MTVRGLLFFVSLIVTTGIATWGCQPRVRSSAPSGRTANAAATGSITATAPATASQAAPEDATAPDSKAFAVQLKPPLMGQNQRDNHVFALEGTLPPRGRVTKSFILPKLEAMNVLVIGDSARYTFRAPNGKTIVPGETKGFPAFERASGMAGLTFEGPEKGKWTLVIESESDRGVTYGIDIRSEGLAEEAAHLETMLRDSDPRFSFLARPGDPVFVRAFVTENGRPLAGATWDIRAKKAEGTPITIPVHDDGRHADGPAHDGISVGALVPEGPDGFYELVATAHAPSGVEHVVTGFFEVQAENDLLIADEIEIEPKQPRAGQPVTLTVTARNAGTVDSRDVELEFYVGARKESSQRFDLGAGESKRISTTWTFGSANNYDVQLTIDTEKEPYASNFENNTKRAVVRVR